MVGASVVTVAYNSGESLTRLLDSLAGQDELLETIVVDNGEPGPELADAEVREGVRVIRPGRNLGFAGGCNAGAGEARGDVIAFLNPDTVLAAGALAALGEAARDPEVGVAMARLRLLDRPELLNSGGNVVHVTGLAWAGGYGEPAELVAERTDVPYPSGAAMAIRADLFRELGGFCEELFMYQEDLELGWRARLLGLRLVVEPGADVYHDYDFARHREKHYLLERNRLVFVLTTYSPRLLLVLAPLLLTTELGLAALAVKQGWLRDKAAGWGWLVRNAPWLARRRRQTQRERRIRDREAARFLTATLDPKMIELPAAGRLANPLLQVYWRAARKLL